MDEKTVTTYNEQTKHLFDNVTLLEAYYTNELFGTEFVLGDGHIQEIID